MKFKRIIAILMMLSIVLISCTSEELEVEGLTMEERLDDFDYLYELIANNYPLLKVNERQNGINWLDERVEFEEKIKKTTTDQEFLIEVKNIVRRLNNNHTHVVDRNYLLELYEFYGDDELGDVFKEWTDIIEDDTVMEWYNINSDDLAITSESNTNHRPLNRQTYSTSIIVPDEVAYLKIKDMMIGFEELESIAEDLRSFFNEVSEYDKLIIDIRGNPGGNDLYWRYGVVPPLIKDRITVENYYFVRGSYAKKFYESGGAGNLYPLSQLDANIMEKLPEEVKTDFQYYGIRNMTIEPLEPVGFKGKIFLLIDDKVFSSADGFAAFAKDSGFATLIGVPTMGDGLSWNPLLASLPNSGIVIRFSGALAINRDGTINAEVGTTPHIEMPNHAFRIGEWDEAIQYVVNYNEVE